jgi:hypothetical protein
MEKETGQLKSQGMAKSNASQKKGVERQSPPFAFHKPVCQVFK